jgi:NAD-dependent SIR2 family protein deacetylase
MSGLFLSPYRHGSAAVAICQRCGFKGYHDAMMQEPVTGLWVCSKCCDEKDPGLLPTPRPENITLQHPRPDEDIEA